MLGVPLDLSPVGVHKSLGVTQAPAKECLELVLRDRDRSLYVISPLVLLAAEADPVPEEERGKGNLGRPRSSNSSKVVLTLLTEVVTVHVGLPTVYVWETGIQLLAGCFGDDGSRSESKSENGSRSGDSSLQNSLKNPLQVILRVLEDISSSSRGVSNGGFRQGSSGLVGQFVT